MKPIEIQSLSHPGAEVFSALTDAQLRNRVEPEKGLFIAESPKVIDVALRAGCIPTAFLCERRHIEGDARELLARCPDVPVFTGSRELLQSLTGYTLTRGVLCAMKRPLPLPPGELLRTAKRVAVIHSVCDTTNIGAIFRSAAALGIDCILLTPDSCDPLNRRAVRVSMGSVFLVPWTWLENPVVALRELGFQTVAMALTDRSVPIDSPELQSLEKVAVILGTEGDGLPESVIADADFTARIPMANGVDSLNVAAASAVAFWQFRPRPVSPHL